MKDKKNLSFKFPLKITMYLMLIFLASAGVIIAIVSIFNFMDKWYVQENILAFLAICIASMFIVNFTLSFIFSNYLNKQAIFVRNLLEEIANGNYDVKLPLPKNEGLLYDITVDFNKMVDELNSTVILQNNFASNFSHEFKTPIVSIKGYAELLKNSENLSKEEYDKYVNIIVEETRRLSNLTKSTLLISKLDAITKLDETAPVKINEQIEECVLLLDGSFQEKNIDVELSLTPHVIETNADTLKDVWINLLTNAIKYNKENGKIIIKSVIENNQYVITFEDTGIGMDKKTLSHIFDKYYQGDSSHFKKGNGLGLPIAKRIIELAGGYIYASSEVDVGTVFTIVFPIAK